MKQDEDQNTRALWSHKELAEGMGLSRGHLYRLLEDGQMLGPDVVVAKDYGWNPERAKEFGVEAQRLDENGRSLGPAGDGDLALAEYLVKSKYGSRPQVYLSSWLASYCYGLTKQAVYFMRKRDGFIPADVALGQGQYRKYGWDESRVIEFGEQTGRLDDKKIDQWVVRRTKDHGLSPDAPWVGRRLAANPKLTSRVERAMEAWRSSQEEAA